MFGANILIVYPVILFVSNNNFNSPKPSGINNLIHVPNNHSKIKLLLASKSPATDIPFDEVLAHMICFVTVAIHVLPFCLKFIFK